ncbi:transcriptional regulator [Elasticomyces elasticus]|nr:transcriptional regulator [Elasticomyces elasticus]KAK3662773.1 transcriptional regulator [Elasticomyces elasticus]KAK4918003.1 transcriptional regulator [Elasticomyces elasticus]KAK5754499.1 transcriptional regulator [Elasticomyces elasticus]
MGKKKKNFVPFPVDVRATTSRNVTPTELPAARNTDQNAPPESVWAIPPTHTSTPTLIPTTPTTNPYDSVAESEDEISESGLELAQYLDLETGGIYVTTTPKQTVYNHSYPPLTAISGDGEEEEAQMNGPTTATAAIGGGMSRQPPTLRNTSKSVVGNGLTTTSSNGLGAGAGGWAGSASGAGGFGLGGGLGQGLAGASGLLGRTAPAVQGPQLSGFAQVLGGGGGAGGGIDMSDFPSLGGGPRPAQSSSNNTPTTATGAGWNSNTIRQSSQIPQQQQQPAQPQQRAPSTAPSQHSSIEQYDGQRTSQPSVERSEDAFPPLSNGIGSSIASPDSTLPQHNGGGSTQQPPQQQQPQQQTQMPIRGPSTNSYSQPPQQQQPQPQQSQATQAPIGSQQPLQPPAQQRDQLLQQQSPALTHQPNGQVSSPSANVKSYGSMTEAEQYGLPGLLAALEARRAIENGQPVDPTLPPAMRNGVILGQDLSTLGMDLDSPDMIYTTFTPFPNMRDSTPGAYDYVERNVVPEFTLPQAYRVGNVPGVEARMGAFSDETLFSIFYQNPLDYRQELAALELTARDWRYHKKLRTWLQKDSPSSTATSSGSSLPIIDLAPGVPVGRESVRVPGGERGVYVFFDARGWRRERREFVLEYGELEMRLAGGVGMSGAGAGIGPAPGLGGPVQAPAPGLGGVGSVGGAVGRGGVVGA